MSNGYSVSVSQYKKVKLLFSLLNGDGKSLKEIEEELYLSERSAKRLIQSIREAIYDIYENTAIIYDRKKRKYNLVLFYSKFIIENLPLF